MMKKMENIVSLLVAFFAPVGAMIFSILNILHMNIKYTVIACILSFLIMVYVVVKKRVHISVYKVLLYAMKYKLGFCKKEKFKEKFYGFLKCLDDVDEYVKEFWASKESKIKQWYILQKKETDVIISASPEFVLSYICDKMNVNLICSSCCNNY